MAQEWRIPAGAGIRHSWAIARKTSLQYARTGEDINRDVAKDARLSESVMMSNYVREMDAELRRASNKTYHRILSSLEPSVAFRYGHPIQRKMREELEVEHATATAAKNWTEAARIATELGQSWG